MTPDEIKEVGQDIASALYARGREVVREAREAGMDDAFLREIETFFMLAAETAMLRALRLCVLSRLPAPACPWVSDFADWNDWPADDDAAPAIPVRLPERVH